MDQVNQNGLCGFRDWRGAKNEDLVSLLTCNYPDCKGEGPHVERNFFPYTARFYWSSSLYDVDISNAWMFDFGNGQKDYYDKNESFYVHLVRDEAFVRKGMRYTKIAADVAELPDSATEWSCVLDIETGLMWEAKTDDGGLHDKDNRLTWSQSFRRLFGFISDVNNEGLCGYRDWRGQKKEELATLLTCKYPDCEGDGPHINNRYFPNTSDGYYWSLSSYDSFGASVWVVNFKDGQEDGYNKSNYLHVILVRDAK